MSKMNALKSLLLLIGACVLAPAAYPQPGYLTPRDKPSGLYQVSMRDKKSGKRRIGFINKTGKLVIGFDRLPERTLSVGEFHEGRARIIVRKEKPNSPVDYKTYLWGYIDETGAVIIAPRFSIAREFSDGLAYVGSVEGLAYPESEEFHGFIDRHGKVIIKFESNSGGNDFHEGLAAGSRDRKWGYIDHSGRWVIKPQYSFAGDFSDGLAAVAMDGRKYGFINQKGEMVIRPHFQLLAYPDPDGVDRLIGYASRFSEGLALVAVDMFDEFKSTGYRTLFGYINKKGDFVVPPQFTDAQDFSEGLAWVVPADNNHFGWIDTSGHWAVTKVDGQKIPGLIIGDWRYSEELGGGDGEFGEFHPFIGGIAKVLLRMAGREEYGYGYIDRTGRFIWRTP